MNECNLSNLITSNFVHVSNDILGQQLSNLHHLIHVTTQI